jgi:hypothetical protein
MLKRPAILVADIVGYDFVPLEERIATFDQDGTFWVEHPIYTQIVYCFDRVPVLAEAKPSPNSRTKSRLRQFSQGIARQWRNCRWTISSRLWARR